MPGTSVNPFISTPYASIANRKYIVLDFLKGPIQAIQEFYELTGRALRNVFRRPHYVDDIMLQMDTIGVGSIPIVLLTGFFTGAVMAMQMGRSLQDYGQIGRTGTFVSIILVRELGPVLTSVMVAGRNSSGIASELGSMKVTEQIDAMRALGTDPVQKLVTPRMIATAVMLPTLTVIDDFIGMVGGWVMSDHPVRFANPAILELNLAGAGMERRGSGTAQALRFFVRGLADWLFLRAADHRWHAGRRPRHHPGGGCGVGHHLRSGSVYRQDLRQPDEVLIGRASILRFENVSVVFDDGVRALDEMSFDVRERRNAHHPGRGGQRQNGAAEDGHGPDAGQCRAGVSVRRGRDQ